MKKVIIFFSITVLLFVSTGCDNQENSPTTSLAESQGSTISTEATKEEITTKSDTTTEETTTQVQNEIEVTPSTSPTSSVQETTTKKDDPITPNWTLTVNGNEISSKYVKCHYDEKYVELPLIAIVKALGAKVVNQDDTMFEFELGEKTFLLNKQQSSLIEEGNNLNLIAKLPGTTHASCRRIEDDDFIVDNDTLSYFFYLAGVIATVDYDSATIRIDYR